MALHDPIAAYNAATNLEAHVVCGALLAAGIEAAVVEDMSLVGFWMFGLLPEIHKPQVWIERADIDRAKPVLDDYERHASERRAAERTTVNTSDNDTIDVTCEECGKQSKFPAIESGTVQNCPHCNAYVDVGDLDSEGWGEGA